MKIFKHKWRLFPNRVEKFDIGWELLHSDFGSHKIKLNGDWLYINLIFENNEVFEAVLILSVQKLVVVWNVILDWSRVFLIFEIFL